jgi:hypothetical protein
MTCSRRLAARDVNLTRHACAPSGGIGRDFARRVDADMLSHVGPAPSQRPRIFICGPTAFVERAADVMVGLGEDTADEQLLGTGHALVGQPGDVASWAVSPPSRRPRPLGCSRSAWLVSVVGYGEPGLSVFGGGVTGMRSTSFPRAMRTSETSSGGNRPCSTTPTVAESRASSCAGSSNAPV